MKLILAQGNPGPNYRDTRHNIGFQILDAFAEKQGVSFSEKPKFHAALAEFSTNEEKVLLVKPLTFYNETGQSARSLVDFYKLDPTQDILVIHDDISLPLGLIRTREKGSDAGNNGIKSLNAHLGSTYKRVRIGMNSESSHNDAAAFVLGTLTLDERKILTQEVEPAVIQIINDFIDGSFKVTSL